MVTRKQSIENFSNKMDELINSKYIMTEKKITNVLKSITSSKLFFELVVFCNGGYDYQSERAQFYKAGEPFAFDNDKDLIAFGVNLLTSLDSKEEDLLTLLSKNYRSDNFDKSYRQFASEFLTAFKDVMVSSASSMINGCACENENLNGGEKVNSESSAVAQKSVQAKRPAKKVEQGEKNEIKKHYAGCYSDLQQAIINERNLIMNSKLSDSEKADLYVLLEAFKECVFMGNRDQMRTSFISYRYAAVNFKKLNSEVDEIERILKFCKVL